MHSNASNACKSSPKPSGSASSSHIQPCLENSNDMNYSNSTHSQAIKQEVESGSVQSEESSTMSHNLVCLIDNLVANDQVQTNYSFLKI